MQQPHLLPYLIIIEYSPQYHYHVRRFEIRKKGVQLVATFLSPPSPLAHLIQFLVQAAID
jgi:hypothetical protein